MKSFLSFSANKINRVTSISKLSKVLQPKKISAILNYIQNNKEDYYEFKNIIFNRDKNKKQEKEIIRKINPWKKI